MSWCQVGGQVDDVWFYLLILLLLLIIVDFAWFRHRYVTVQVRPLFQVSANNTGLTIQSEAVINGVKVPLNKFAIKGATLADLGLIENLTQTDDSVRVGSRL